MDEKLRRRLERVFRRYTGIQAVYLFGSMAEGRAKAESDLDLAIIASTPDVKAKKLGLLAVWCG